MHVSIYPKLLWQDMTRGKVFSGIELVLIMSFPSPGMVTVARLKTLVFPTIYSLLEERDGLVSYPKGISTKRNTSSLALNMGP